MVRKAILGSITCSTFGSWLSKTLPVLSTIFLMKKGSTLLPSFASTPNALAISWTVTPEVPSASERFLVIGDVIPMFAA